MPVQPETVDLGDIARVIVDEIRVIHPSRQLSVECRGTPIGAWDRARMGQLVSNLVANAIEHGSDPITVHVEGRDVDVLIRVANRGAPIPQALLPDLFDPFRRFGRRDEHSHLGLGLFIVKEIVRRHSGELDVASTHEETAFSVRLPRAPEWR
jgi:signal transduction histidine kinase